jgi:hypothetical protein
MENPDEFNAERLQILRSKPTEDNIYDFIKAIFDCAQFSIECCIIALIYMNRIIGYINTNIMPTNWRPLYVCALLVAQKVWDDR